MHIVNDLRYEHCPLCNSDTIFKVGDIEYDNPVMYSTMDISLSNEPELWGCARCLSRFVQNAIPEHITVKLYEQGIGGKRWVTGPIIGTKHLEIIEMLIGVFKKGLDVLDIGANTGELLDFAKAKGCRTCGVEFSGSSRELLMRKGHGAFRSIDEITGSFDVITAFDLVEHLYRLPGFFEFCRARLSEGGTLLILTGNFDSFSARKAGANWWYFKYPEHIVFPSRKYFESFTGFHVEEWVRTYSSRIFEGPLLNAFYSFILGMLKGNYTGQPSIGPDHVLTALRK